ncbi:hypothetical protein IP93_00686 [Lysobacter ruishenii]|uniref:Uncharacterized protein n=2 Tax=Aerolutibacter ruishenii TaxID=686800 RepID=A0A562M0Q1_9GAMM|nr:hypothetical protein IP93_00686 [Lysobacter ruishenii]
MPLYSFALYARQQSNQKNVSAYGIAFLKAEFYAAGGRPAIYGLASEDVTYVHNDAYHRIFHEHILPRSEQYRYVAYSPSGDHWIDWSHEREWRWRVRDKDEEFVWSMDGQGCYSPIPGLPLLKGRSEGAHFSKLCIIVWSKEEATEIQSLLTGYYLAGYNNYSTPFDRAVIANSRIIVLQEVIEAVEKNGNLDAQTIEGLEDADLVTPIVISSPPPDAGQVIATAFAAATHAGRSAAKAYIEMYPKDEGYCGYAHVATSDVTHPLVQYMLNSDLASGPYDGRAHISVPKDWPSRQSLDYNEHVYRAVAHVLSHQLQLRCWMHSRPD